MTNYDDYFTNNDKPFSENLNSSLLLSNAFDVVVPIEIPKMFSNGSFENNTAPRKCGTAIVTLRTTLQSGITINDDGNLTGTGTVQLKFYPNFNNFNKITDISWDDSEDIIINLKKQNGAVIASEINNGVIESESEDLRKLQEIIIEIILNNATLSDFKITMKGKEGDRYGAEVTINEVDELDDLLDDIKDENIEQDSRLDDIESLGVVQNARLTSIENDLSSIYNYNYKIKPSNYNPKIDTNITVSVEVTDKNGNLMPYTSITLSHTRYKRFTYPYEKLTTTVTGQTNENGIATFTIKMITWGTWDFQVGDEHCQIYVDGWRSILGSSSGTYQILRNKTHGKLLLKGVSASNIYQVGWRWQTFTNDATAELIRPVMPVLAVIGSGDIYIKINGYGDIAYACSWEANYLSRTLWGQIEWEICDEDLSNGGYYDDYDDDEYIVE